jgi:hypothetical protein
MSHTINFDEDFIADDELRLLETKNAILKKLRLRFSMLDESSGCAIITGQRAWHSTPPAKHTA